MKISKEEVQRIGKLAKLKLSDEEAIEMTKELMKILGYFESIKEYDLSHVDAVVLEEEATVYRKDQVTLFKDNQKLFQNTKDMREGYIRIPKVIE